MNEKKIGKKTIIIGVVALVVAAAIAIGLLLTGKEDKKETVKEPSSNVVVNKGENNTTSEETIIVEENTEDTKEGSTQKEKKDTYTITFYDENGRTVLQTSEVKAGSTPKYDGALPTKQESVSHTFTFAGWDKEIKSATEDASYKAVYSSKEKNKYNVTFYDSDQQTVISKKVVYEGQMPTYNGETPTKGETETTTYEFAGWDKKFDFITSDTNYFAKYTATEKKQYTAKFYNEDGTKLLQSKRYYEGQKPKYDGVTPTKSETVSHTFKFTGWDKSLKEIEADTDYYAKFEDVEKNKFTATFYGENSTILQQSIYYKGETPKYEKDTPTKEETNSHTYKFTGWDKKLAPITEDTTYNALFTETEKKKYTAAFYNNDGTLLLAKQFYKGETPVYDGDVIPSKARDDFYVYTFNRKWSPELTEILADTAYVPQFDKEILTTEIENINISKDILNEFGYLTVNQENISVFHIKTDEKDTKVVDKDIKALIFNEASSMAIPDLFIAKNKSGHDIIPKKANDAEIFYVVPLGVSEVVDQESGEKAYRPEELIITCRNEGTKKIDDLYYNNLTSEKKYRITGIGDQTFKNYEKLELLTLPDSIKTIGKEAFDGCIKLARIIYNGTIEQWEDIKKGTDWDKGCENFVIQCLDGDIKKDVSKTGNVVFDDGEKYTYFDGILDKQELADKYGYDRSVLSSMSIGDNAFKNTRVIIFEIPNDITSLGKESFMNASKLRKVILSSNLTIISESVFEGCTSLAEVTMSNSIEKIESKAFGSCANLTVINYHGTKDEWNNIEKASNWNVGVGKITVKCSDGDIEVEEGPLTFMMMIRSFLGMSPVPIEDSLTSNNDETSSNLLNEGSSTGDNKQINSLSNNTNSTSISQKTGTNSNVTTYGNSKDAFSIKSTNIEQIGYNEDISKLVIKSAFVGDGENGTIDGEKYNVKAIGSKAFANCENLTEIVIDEGIETIEKDAFRNCSKLVKITIPSTIQSIGDDVFYNCSKLTNIIYSGTTAEWNSISKWKNWNSGTIEYTVHCVDGSIKK